MTDVINDLTTDSLDADMTVNQVIDRFPNTLGVFNAHGIHSCCGGSVPLAAAAERDGVELDQLLAALRSEVEDRG